MMSHRAARRPAVHVETLVALVAAFVMAAGNGPFWHALLAGRPLDAPSTWFYSAAVYVALTGVYVAFAAMLANRWTVRPLLAVFLVVTAAASWFMQRYAVYMDPAMIRNVLATNVKEAGELVAWPMVLHVLLFGVLPAAALWWPTLRRRPLARAVAVRMGWVIGSLVVSVCSLMLVFADFGSEMRNHREIRHLITPGNVVNSLVANFFGESERPAGPRQAVAQDAVVAARSGERRPMLFVLVVGETARAQNFSLDGYGRDTNPSLERRDVINFPRATACGTSTEVSLPCMFSPYGRTHYDESKILAHESVLNVLARVGVHVLWRDNQSGCKGVCDGLPVDQLDGENVPTLCADGQCFDGILLHGLDKVLRDGHGDQLVVLHMLGSHGPSYFRRYPPAFSRFRPECLSDDLRSCDTQQIVNAYDNSILYTDAVLGQVIDFLAAAQATHDTAMLYMSDHGESLGEAGLYLHGVPWAIAPSAQTHVPFVLWMSPAFARDRDIDVPCQRDWAARNAVSHDNLFHTLLGIFDVHSKSYDPERDIFAACRRERPS